jgi:hypothetical protein
MVPSVRSGSRRTSRASATAKTTLVATTAHYGHGAELLRWERRDNEGAGEVFVGPRSGVPGRVILTSHTRSSRAPSPDPHGGLWEPMSDRRAPPAELRTM